MNEDANKWISVKDTLPEHGDRVLVIVREPNPLMNREIKIAFYNERLKMWYEDCDFCSIELDAKGAPTEWRSLPQGPE